MANGIFANALDYETERRLWEMQQHAMEQMHRHQNSVYASALGQFGLSNAAPQTYAVPKPDPSTNPILLLTGEDE